MADFSLWKKLERKRALLSFELELTARCNLNCRHCYINLPAGDRKAEKQELTLEEITRVGGEAASLGAIWCLLSGGEPLLRDDFFDVYLALKKQGLLVSVFTNATLISGRHIDFFKTYPPRDIEVTVYGATPDTYEAITRRKGSYKAFRRGLDLLLSAGLPVSLKAMAMRSNLKELRDIARFCREHSYRRFRFDPFLHLRYDGDQERNREIISERLSPEQVITLEKSFPSRLEGLKKAKIFYSDPGLEQPDSCRLFGCGIGKEQFTVSSEGMFTFCSSLRHPDCVTDLKKESLKEAWEGLFVKVREMASGRREYLSNCAYCPIINICRWCPALAHLETGRLDSPVEYFCRVAHDRKRALSIDDKSTENKLLKEYLRR